MNIAIVILFIGFMIFLSHLFQEIFKRKRIPDVLILFIIGLIVGPFTGLIKPEHFGVVGQIFTTVTLVFILFEGSMGLCIDTIKNSWKASINVSLINFFATMLVVGILGPILTNLGIIASLMLGAIIGGTSSIVVIPLVEQLRMSKQSGSILILESAFTDLFCIMFALAFLEALKAGTFHPGAIIGNVISSFVMGGFIGILGALIWSMLLNKIRTIKNSIFMTPAFVFIIFGISEMLGYSGAISSLTFGFTLANIKLFSFKLIDRFLTPNRITLNDTEKSFQSEIVFLLKTFFFIYMGISIQLSNLLWIFIGLIITIILFLLRIFVIRFGASSDCTRNDASYMAAILPKGLAAAVLASIPLQENMKGGDFIQSVVFSVILFSIIISSVLIFMFDKIPRVKHFYYYFLSKFSNVDEEEKEEMENIDVSALPDDLNNNTFN